MLRWGDATIQGLSYAVWAWAAAAALPPHHACVRVSRGAEAGRPPLSPLWPPPYDLLDAHAGLLVQSFTQDGRFPTYCPGGTQPDPEYHFTVDKYSTVNVEEITINQDLSWYCAGNVSAPFGLRVAYSRSGPSLLQGVLCSLFWKGSFPPHVCNPLSDAPGAQCEAALIHPT